MATTLKEFIASKKYFARSELRAAFEGDDPDSWGMGEDDIPVDVIGFLRYMFDGSPVFVTCTQDEFHFELDEHGWVKPRNQDGLDAMEALVYTYCDQHEG
jgi:hypothetical protein